MDHERVNIHQTSMSCGVMELSRIDDDTIGVLYALASRLYHPSRGQPCAYFVFSDIVPKFEDDIGTSSSRLIKKVREYMLGSVTQQPSAENPKTGNIITIYVWLIDHEKFKTWYSTMRKAKLSTVGS